MNDDTLKDLIIETLSDADSELRFGYLFREVRNRAEDTVRVEDMHRILLELVTAGEVIQRLEKPKGIGFWQRYYSVEEVQNAE